MTRHDDPGRRPATELDRLLGEWLADGPGRAPEAPITVAIEFARAHPRRSDPLRAFRRDPMGARGGGLSLLQPAFALLTLGLLVAALVGVGVVGGLLRASPAPVPAPTGAVVPPPSASPTPSATPSPSPSPTPATFDVTIQTESAVVDFATVVDRSGRVTAATDVTRTTESRQLGGPVFIAQVDATSVDIGWVDNGCDGVRYTLTLDETASQLVLTRPVCGGDSSALGRWVRLTFDGPIDAATITATEDGPGASPPG